MAVRKIPIQSQSVAGYFYSEKNKKILEFESQLEKKYFYLLEFDDNVESYHPQPLKVESDFNGKKVWYIPDVLVSRVNDIPLLVEVKYSKEFKEISEKLKNKIIKLRDYCKLNGMKFYIFTEKKIKQPYFDNIKFLYQYREQPKIKNISTLTNQIMEIAQYPISIEDILIKLTNDKFEQAMLLPLIWHLVYIRKLELNIYKELSNTSIVRSVL